MKTKLAVMLGMLAVAAATSAAAQAADPESMEPQRCISLRTIDHTEVLDDQNILFYMRGDRIFLNRLKHSTPGLRKDQPFMYETVGSQLCANDQITVLERWPFGLTRLGSASLGQFEPIDEDGVEVLKNPGSAAEDVVEHIDIE